jgi:very-short-patch-repair endonuclease
LRGKQIAGIQFYRQKPIGNYIVDFYAPKAKLVIEIDGSQHLEPHYAEKDQERDEYLNRLGLTVLRFNSREVLKESEGVMEVIYRAISERMAE